MSRSQASRALLLLLLITEASAMANKSPLVFIHGIKGATLVDKDGDLRWLGSAGALGLSSPKLALEPSFGADRRQPSDGLRASGVLATVPVIPWLYEAAVYGPWLRAAETVGRPFHPFAYDWRRELDESVAAFEKFVEDARAAHGGAKVLAVGHSMGGLILFSLLCRRPELFSGAVFAGVPFDGGIGFLPDLQAGTKNGLNGRILAPDVLATFPSVYALFGGLTEGLEAENGEPDRTDLSSAAEWKRQRLGPYAPGRTPSDAFDAFFTEAVARAKAFRATFTPRVGASPPVAVVIANHLPTLARGRRNGPEARLGWDFTSGAKRPGDGRVKAEAAMPPGGVPYEVILSKSDHANLLNEPAVQRRIFDMD